MPKVTVPWNEKFYMEFCKLGMLNDLEKEVLRERIMCFSITEISMHLNVSTATVSRVVAALRKKYDDLQAHSDTLPKRRVTEQEKWMDEH